MRASGEEPDALDEFGDFRRIGAVFEPDDANSHGYVLDGSLPYLTIRSLNKILTSVSMSDTFKDSRKKSKKNNERTKETTNVADSVLKLNRFLKAIPLQVRFLASQVYQVRRKSHTMVHIETDEFHIHSVVTRPLRVTPQVPGRRQCRLIQL